MPEGSGDRFALVTWYSDSIIRSPPANSSPGSGLRFASRRVWHHWQVPSWTKYAPRFTGVDRSGIGTGAEIGIGEGATMLGEALEAGRGFRMGGIERRETMTD